MVIVLLMILFLWIWLLLPSENDDQVVDRAERRFRFEPRWKEVLVVRAEAGAFELVLSMGIMTAYLPAQAEWQRQAPEWARPLWPQLRDELEEWCRGNGTQFIIDPSGTVSPYYDAVPIVTAGMKGWPFSRTASVSFMLLCTAVQTGLVLLAGCSTFGSILMLGWLVLVAGWLLLIRHELFPAKP